MRNAARLPFVKETAKASRWPCRRGCPPKRRARVGQPHGPDEQAPAPRVRTAPPDPSPQPPRQRPARRPTPIWIVEALPEASSQLEAPSSPAAGPAAADPHPRPAPQRQGDRSRRRHPVRSRAKGIARDIRQQGRPCICPRGNAEANPHAFGRAERDPGFRSGANLHAHPRTGGEKRLLARGKRGGVLDGAVNGRCGRSSGSGPEPAPARSSPVAPTGSSTCRSSAAPALPRESPRKRATPPARPAAHPPRRRRRAGRRRPPRKPPRDHPSCPRFAGTSRCDPVIGNAAFRRLASSAPRTSPASANSHRPLTPSRLAAATAFRINAATFSRPLASRARRHHTLRRDQRTSYRRRKLPKIANPSATRAIVTPISEQPLSAARFLVHCPIGIRQQHHVVCNRSIHADILAHPLEHLRPCMGLVRSFADRPTASRRRPAALSDDRFSEPISPIQSLSTPISTAKLLPAETRSTAVDGRTTRRRTWPSGAPGDRNARWRPSRCAEQLAGALRELAGQAAVAGLVHEELLVTASRLVAVQRGTSCRRRSG